MKGNQNPLPVTFSKGVKRKLGLKEHCDAVNLNPGDLTCGGMAYFHSPIACDFLNRSQQRSRPKEHFDVNSNPWGHKWGEGFLPSRPPSAGVIFFDVSSSKFLKSSAWALSRSAENDHVIPGKTNSRLPSKTGICHGSRIDPLRASLHYHHSTISESTEEVHLACPGHCPANGTIFPIKSPISFRW